MDVGSQRLRGRVDPAAALSLGAPATLVVRPERVRLRPTSNEPDPGAERLSARVLQAVYLGHSVRYELSTDAGTAFARVGVGDGAFAPSIGEAIWVTWDPADARVVPGHAVADRGSRPG